MAIMETPKKSLYLMRGKGDEVNPRGASSTLSYSSLKLCLWSQSTWDSAGLPEQYSRAVPLKYKKVVSFSFLNLWQKGSS